MVVVVVMVGVVVVVMVVVVMVVVVVVVGVRVDSLWDCFLMYVLWWRWLAATKLASRQQQQHAWCCALRVARWRTVRLRHSSFGLFAKSVLYMYDENQSEMLSFCHTPEKLTHIPRIDAAALHITP